MRVSPGKALNEDCLTPSKEKKKKTIDPPEEADRVDTTAKTSPVQKMTVQDAVEAGTVDFTTYVEKVTRSPSP